MQFQPPSRTATVEETSRPRRLRHGDQLSVHFHENPPLHQTHGILALGAFVRDPAAW
eukprot:COSAG02_NODE_3208_length_7162_cov_236.150538_2_plen_57_part_00